MMLRQLSCVSPVSVVFRHRYKVLLILYIMYILWLYFHYFMNSSYVAFDDTVATCSLVDGQEYIRQLCYNYSHGDVAGSFCKSLCIKNDLTYIKCMSHKSDSIILLANWNQSNNEMIQIVLKADHISDASESEAIPRTTNYYSRFLESIVLFNNVSFSVAKHILSECDKNSDGIITFRETSYCWHMHKRDEILIMMLLSDNNAIPNLYGTCGNMMAVEYITSAPLVGLEIIKDYMSWSLRARMSVALIEMMESLEDTEYGTLYLCDFQRSNFGFVIDANGHLVAKSIDNDLSLFKNQLYEQLTLEEDNLCTSDKDCEFLSCKVPCDKITGKCSGKLVTNNLQVLCSLFLLSESEQDFLYSGLLRNPPNEIRKQVTSLLHQCAHPLSISDKISINLASQLKHVLKKSIEPSSDAINDIAA